MKVQGRVRVPGDKSISHRALMFAALADGRSRVHAVLQSADVKSTAGVLRALGVSVPKLSDDFTVDGKGLRGLESPSAFLDCGNSGTTTRLMAGVVSGANIVATFVGDESLSKRPMKRIARPLSEMGARFEFASGVDGLPMTIHGGALHPLAWKSDTASAQVKSAVLLAGLVGGIDVSVVEPFRSRDHTERMLAARGVRIEVDGAHVRLHATERLQPLDVDVPADPSSAAFLAGVAALADDGEIVLESVCVNPTRTGFFDVLRNMGATVEELERRDEGGEPVATLRIRPGTLRGVRVGGDVIPTLIDEIPLIACLAARAEGETLIEGAEELRVKESDRIATVVGNLRALGADVEELPDGMRIVGSDKPLRGSVRAHADHRIAMAFGVLGAVPGNVLEIDDTECVDVSYPNFWTDLQRVVRP